VSILIYFYFKLLGNPIVDQLQHEVQLLKERLAATESPQGIS
jgi:hypothetical protein